MKCQKGEAKRKLTIRTLVGRREEVSLVRVTLILSKPFRKVFIGRYVTPCTIELEQGVYIVQSDKLGQGRSVVLKEKNVTVTFVCSPVSSKIPITVAEYKFLVLDMLAERGGLVGPRIIYPYLLDELRNRFSSDDLKQRKGEPKWKVVAKQALLELGQERDIEKWGYQWRITEQGRKTHSIMKAFNIR